MFYDWFWVLLIPYFGVLIMYDYGDNFKNINKNKEV